MHTSPARLRRAPRSRLMMVAVSIVRLEYRTMAQKGAWRVTVRRASPIVEYLGIFRYEVTLD